MVSEYTYSIHGLEVKCTVTELHTLQELYREMESLDTPTPNSTISNLEDGVLTLLFVYEGEDLRVLQKLVDICVSMVQLGDNTADFIRTAFCSVLSQKSDITEDREKKRLAETAALN